MKKTGKGQIVNFLYQFVYQVLVVLLPLITAPYISRVLGAERSGIYSYTYVLSHYFLTFAMLGIDSYGNRSIARVVHKGQEHINKTFSSIFQAHAMVSVITIAVYFIYVLFFMKEYKFVALCQSFFVISAFFEINWFFFGIEKFKLTVARNVIIKLLTVCAMFVFVRTKEDLWKYAIIMSGGTFISQLAMWLYLPKYAKFVKVSLKDSLKHFKPLCVLFLAVIATTLYGMIDKMMLGWIGDMEFLGSYDYADKMMKITISLINALGVVMLPRMSALFAEGNQSKVNKYLNNSSQFIFFMSFAIAFGLAGIAKEFMAAFLGAGYDSADDILHVLAVAVPFMGWNDFVRTQILMPKSKDLVYTRAVWAGAIVNIVLNIVFLYLWGVMGIAIATVIAYIVTSLFQTIPIRDEFDIVKYLRHAIFPITTGAIMYVVIRFIGNVMGGGWTTVFIEILVGASLYVVLNLIYLLKTKNEILLSYTNKIFKKDKQK